MTKGSLASRLPHTTIDPRVRVLPLQLVEPLLRPRVVHLQRHHQPLMERLRDSHRAENGDAAAFRLMQAQAMRVGQRRIELSLRIAEIEGPAGQGRRPPTP